MTTAVSQSPAPAAVYSGEALFPLSVAQYHEMIRNGTLSEADPVELLEGILLYKMPKKPPHAAINTAVQEAIASLLPAQFHFRSQDPITLVDGEPEPDGAVVRGRSRDFMSRHPEPTEIPLVIEVADTSLERDRGIKMRGYARGGIAEYWIVNLIDRTIEVYTDPDAKASGGPSYLQRTVYTAGDAVPLVIAGSRLGDVAASAVLP
jgi:Uma2 family endonuclease